MLSAKKLILVLLFMCCLCLSSCKDSYIKDTDSANDKKIEENINRILVDVADDMGTIPLRFTAALGDLNSDGVPELFVSAMLPNTNQFFDVYDLSSCEMIINNVCTAVLDPIVGNVNLFNSTGYIDSETGEKYFIAASYSGGFDGIYNVYHKITKGENELYNQEKKVIPCNADKTPVYDASEEVNIFNSDDKTVPFYYVIVIAEDQEKGITEENIKNLAAQLVSDYFTSKQIN